MPNGYNGRIARVNLTKRSVTVEEPSEGWYRIYMGGGAAAAYYLLKELAPGVDPLSPENILIFACSVVTGSPISGFSRYTVAAKSPLTGAFGESEASGYFGPEMKFSGFDALVIQGKADAPVYLWLHDGQCEIRDASALWGLDNGAAKDALVEELEDKRIRIASIGQAGERLIPFACVINELGHANGRTGMGAVMGSKNLKAVVARGKPENQTYADPEGVKAVSKWQIEQVKNHGPSQFMHKYGTPGLVMGLSSSGILPTRNWRESVFEGADNINGVAMNDTVLKRAATCYRCSVACKRVVEYKDERFSVDPRYGGPEYETLGSFGSLCGVDDLPAICKAHELCNSWGMDTISAGGMIAFAMECFEEGILTAEDNDGRVIKFGDADGMLWLLEKIVNQEGLGKILAKGIVKASKEIGRGSEQFAFSIKGQEIPLHDPRGKTGVGLGYAVSPTGADHIESPHEGAFVGDAVKLLNPIGVMEAPDPLAVNEVKTAQFRKMQLTWSMNNVLGLCNFAVAPLFSLTYDKMVEAVTAITGWKTSLWDLMLAAERAENMYRVFNNREGFGVKDDHLFSRLHEPISGGPLKGAFIDRENFNNQLKMYYKIMGWDENGVPTREKLIDLDLGWLTEQ